MPSVDPFNRLDSPVCRQFSQRGAYTGDAADRN
jgi:hypothetical protein